jgi:DNA polymerase-1
LITENIKVIKPGKSTDQIIIVDKEKVIVDYGFEPEKMIDYLALVGDSSDDIPGVAGIGPKTATPLIRQFGSVEGIYENIASIEKKGVKNKLLENKENAFLSKELATIITDAPFEFNIEEAKFEKPDIDKLFKLFAELEFKNFGPRLANIFKVKLDVENIKTEEDFSESKTFDKNKVNYKLIKNYEDAEELSKKLSSSDLFVFDTETDSLDVLNVRLAGVAFSVKEKEAYFVATDPGGTSGDIFSQDLSDRLSIEDFTKLFKPVFENEKIKKVCQNGKYDIAILRTYGIELENFYFDTMLANYIYNPDLKHGMDELSEMYLNYSPISFETMIGSKKNPEKIFDIDAEKLSNYASEDADVTYRLFNILDKKLKEEKLEEVAYKVEFPLVPVLEDMERTGVKIDIEMLKSFSNDLLKLMNEQTEKIYELAGTEFNLNSPKQLQEILFDKLNLPKTKKTKTGYSTDARSLESLRGSHEIIDYMLEYRQVTKLKSTYADALPKMIRPQTGKVHTTFNQTVATTGRLSSIDPNLQNIPIRTTMGKEIRKAFIADNPGNVILSADYSQIELRIMASICEDESLMQAFVNGEDIHRSTAALVFQVPPEEVTADMRRKAKEVNFGILYGIGPFGLKTRLGITQTHAKEIIDTYFNTFKNVRAYIDGSIQSAKEKLYAETLIGRRRFLRNINSKNRMVSQGEQRIAINMPIQGTAADMIKLAMINIFNELNKRKLKTKMILQVHDELLFDTPKEEVDIMQPMVKELMEKAFPLKVPVIVDTGVGENWLDAH